MPLLWTAALLYLGWGLLLFLAQRSILFPGAALSSAHPTGRGPEGIEVVRVPFSGGEGVAWFIPAPGSSEGPGPALLMAHGNAELIDHAAADGRRFAGAGISVLLIEYPGYGHSDGSPSRASIGELFLAAYDLLATRPDVDADRIVGFGRSLGSGAITDLATKRGLRALILQSPFVSTASFAKGYLLPGWLVRDRFDNADALRRFQGPILLFHGTRDRVIPHSHSEQLVSVARNATLVSLECGHNDCPPDPGAFLSVVREFLVRHEVVPPGAP